MVVMLLVLLALIILLLGWFFFAYNSLVRLKIRVDNAWSQIDVQLKRRHDLIPNLVESVKGYMAYEKDTLERVIKARTQAIDAAGIKDKAQAENLLTQTLRSLFAVVERYPDLKANQNVLSLQGELTSTENKISFARQYYNDEVGRYNTLIEVVPTNIVASAAGFAKRDFFEIEDKTEREAPKVKL
ncbi:LemA/RetS hybrid sensor kinase-response regulator protein [Candidatus Velamenicoccus archaeovorus]|uniref:LemA/RetS hybrid sensor kinase-response regulator protein n=1 Tax=Velamenicoccus archaeovorus TaxID=1930593 RepID=A0A410P5V2_VELA1|nr:LemA family protein [Candidatus Velamenicoccus archaeovorus]QAT17448.1 LemA/RetS hybrid sensor kinase-response regulator protein [Candidatus Velamenicoccus archaeovorus]